LNGGGNTQFAGVAKRLVSHCSIIDVDEECFSDGGSFETPQKEIALKIIRIRKAIGNVLCMVGF